MTKKTRKKSLLLALIIASVLSVSICLAGGPYKFACINKITKERLRDFTFPIWESNALKKHMYLVFLENDKSFSNNYAYAGHGYGFLGFMYLLDKIENSFASIPMRVTVICTSLALSVGLILLIISRHLKNYNIQSYFLMTTFLTAFISCTDIWWTNLFNVDNAFLIFTPIYGIFLFYFLQQKNEFKWIGLVLTLVSPVTSFFCFLVLFLRSLTNTANRYGQAYLTCFCLASIFFALLPHYFVKLLNFNSASSSILFRTGLDGDRTYFKNQIQAVFFPFFPRPSFSIFLLIFMCMGLFLFLFKYLITVKTKSKSYPLSISYPIFGLYGLHVLIFPQAISIHPYLYDYLIVFPCWLVILAVQIETLNLKLRNYSLLYLFNVSFAIFNFYNVSKIFQQAINSNLIPFGSVK